MLFVIQKIIWFIILPPSSMFIMILAGYLLAGRYRRTGRGLIITGLALLYLLSLGHVADMLLRPLERGSLPLKPDGPIAADAIVVPGGGSVDLDWLGAGPVLSGENYARVFQGVELARKLDIPLVLTGGNGEPFTTKLRDADVMAEAALAMGVPRKRIIVENESRNTLENSHAVRKIVKGNRIVLATSAYYMRRARVMFERRGFTVMPAPVYYLVSTRKCNPASLIPRAGDLSRSSTAVAERLGRIWWRIRGEM